MFLSNRATLSIVTPAGSYIFNSLRTSFFTHRVCISWDYPNLVFLHSPLNAAADFRVSGAVPESQALPLQHMLRCWWEGLMLLKGFAGENIFLRRNKWGVKFPLNLFTSQGCRANVPYESFSLLAWLCLIASATLNICSDLHPSWQA